MTKAEEKILEQIDEAQGRFLNDYAESGAKAGIFPVKGLFKVVESTTSVSKKVCYVGTMTTEPKLGFSKEAYLYFNEVNTLLDACRKAIKLPKDVHVYVEKEAGQRAEVTIKVLTDKKEIDALTKTIKEFHSA